MRTLSNIACEYRGLKDDTKPTGPNLPNGSVFIEIDTGKVFMYDQENQQWKEL